MSKSTKTIRWDDPAYSVRSSESASDTAGDSLSNHSFGVPVANAMGAIPKTSASQNVVSSTSWRELHTRDGRTYYYNSVTQKTVWEMPQEYRDYLEFMKLYKGSKGSGSSGSSSVAADTASGDEAFWVILKERQVTSKWSWEEALRAIISHPNYRCIPTLQERKASFQRYCDQMRVIEEEEAKLQTIAIREAFKSMLASDPAITGDSKWSEAVDRHGKNNAFLAVPNNRERVQLFEEYQSELRRTELEIIWAHRKTGFLKIRRYLDDFMPKIDFKSAKSPSWPEMKDELLVALPLEGLEPIDYLHAFEEWIDDQVKEYHASRKVERQAELMKELELREKFKFRLEQFIELGTITPFSSWSTCYPAIRETEEFKDFSAIYLYGSTPLDLFYDALDKLQQSYLLDRVKIADSLDSSEKGSLLRELSSFPRFRQELSASIHSLSSQNSLQYAFYELYQKDGKEDERDRINVYKHFLKHFTSPPIKSTDQWSEFRLHLQGHSEFEALDESSREIYFLKYLKWLSKHSDQVMQEPQTIPNRERSASRERRRRTRSRSRSQDNSEYRRRRRRYSSSPSPPSIQVPESPCRDHHSRPDHSRPTTSSNRARPPSSSDRARPAITSDRTRPTINSDRW